MHYDNQNTSSLLLSSRKNIIAALRLIVFSIIYLIAIQELNTAQIPHLFWFILAIFCFSELVYLFEHRTHFFVQRILTWIFLFDAVLISLLIYLLPVKSTTLFISYFAVIAIAAMTKRVAASFVIAFLASIFYLMLPLSRGEFIFTEFFTRIIFFFGVALFTGYLAEAAHHQFQEKIDLAKQLRQAQKMEAMGPLASGIAHDFNNIIMVIRGYTEMAFSDILPDHPLHKTLSVIKREVERANILTRQLMAFSRPTIFRMQKSDLNEIIADLTRLILISIRESIDLKIIPGRKLKSIDADHGALEQILINLCINARDAISGEGVISIETQNVFLSESNHEAPLGSKPGHYILLTISDTGAGISKKIQERIFEPFFTTKQDGKGTGLGLAMVSNLIKQHNGFIEVASEIGRWTTFKIYFPAVEGEAEKVTVPQNTGVWKGKETILLAEDDSALRELVKTALAKNGYTVLTASDGEETLKIFNAPHTPKIDLVVLDVVMPKLNGYTVYNQLKTGHPQTRFLFMTGYVNDPLNRKLNFQDV